MLEALLILATVTSLPACDGYEISANNVGPVSIGMHEKSLREELAKANLPFGISQINLEGDLYTQFTVTLCEGGKVTATFELDGPVYSLTTPSPLFRLENGAHVGMTLGELQEIYPDGEVIYGLEENWYFVFVTGEPGVYFDFDHRLLSRDCLERRRDCPSDFSGFRPNELRLR